MKSSIEYKRLAGERAKQNHPGLTCFPYGDDFGSPASLFFFWCKVKKVKPFFYKIIAAEFMAEVFKIPRGKHKEWLSQFALDLVSANGTTEYTKKLIAETQEFRDRQAENGRKGGKSGRKAKKGGPEAPLSDTQAPLSDTQASQAQPLGRNRSISSSTDSVSTKGEQTNGQLSPGWENDIFTTEDGTLTNRHTGEEVNPF